RPHGVPRAGGQGRAVRAGLSKARRRRLRVRLPPQGPGREPRAEAPRGLRDAPRPRLEPQRAHPLLRERPGRRRLLRLRLHRAHRHDAGHRRPPGRGLRPGQHRDDARLQQAIGFILSCQNGASGGFAPTTGFFETPAATADVIWGLDAYLRAPATGRETYTQAQVQAAVDAALGYLAAQLDPVTHYWQQNVGANAQIVGPVARYYAARDLAQPQWLLDGAQVLLDHQNAQGGLTYNSGSGVAV